MKYFLCMSNKFGGAERVGTHVADILCDQSGFRAVINGDIASQIGDRLSSALLVSIPRRLAKISDNPMAILYFLFVSVWFVVVGKHDRKSVYYCNDIESVFVASLAKLLFRGKIIWHVHDVYKIDKKATKLVLQIVSSVTDTLISLTELNAKRMSALFGCRIDVIPNFFRLEPTYRQHGFDSQKALLLGYLGQITEWKQVDAAIEMTRVLKDEFGVNVALKIAGRPLFQSDENYHQMLMARSAGLSYVQWLGPVDEVPSFLSSIDFLVSLSRNEPFGLVIVEALSQGVPVISTNGDGPSEILKDGVGLLLDGGVRDYAAQVMSFVSALDAEGYSALSRRCVEVASKSYSVEVFNRAIRSLMADLDSALDTGSAR